MTVYIVQKPKPGPNGITYDITPAEEHGKVKFIFDAYENPSSHPAAAIEKVREILNDFDSEKDYVVAAGGDPYGLFLVGYIIGELGQELKWLRFERIRERPTPGKPQEQKSAGYYVSVDMPKSAY
jgi:hypothetical protein